jgi:hypothetical protein
MFWYDCKGNSNPIKYQYFKYNCKLNSTNYCNCPESPACPTLPNIPECPTLPDIPDCPACNYTINCLPAIIPECPACVPNISVIPPIIPACPAYPPCPSLPNIPTCPTCPTFPDIPACPTCPDCPDCTINVDSNSTIVPNNAIVPELICYGCYSDLTACPINSGVLNIFISSFDAYEPLIAYQISELDSIDPTQLLRLKFYFNYTVDPSIATFPAYVEVSIDAVKGGANINYYSGQFVLYDLLQSTTFIDCNCIDFNQILPAGYDLLLTIGPDPGLELSGYIESSFCVTPVLP